MSKNFLRNNNPLPRYIICFGASISAILLSSFIMAIIASSTKNPGGLTDILSLVALLLGGIFCGVFTTAFYKSGSMGFLCLVASGVVVAMLVSCLIISGGKISASAFMNYACYLGVALLFGFFARSKGKKRKIRRR